MHCILLCSQSNIFYIDLYCRMLYQFLIMLLIYFFKYCKKERNMGERKEIKVQKGKRKGRKGERNDDKMEK